MTEDPYRLARDIRGIGFRSADAIAMRLGLTMEAPKRLRAGVSFALQTATDEGHCALPFDELVGLAEKLLEVPAEPIRAAIDAELADGKVVLDGIEDQSCLFLKGLHAAERDIAQRLKSLARGDLPWPQIEIERAIPWVGQRTGKVFVHFPT
jgi:exodeoxyribonuclease V alpha subunit